MTPEEFDALARKHRASTKEQSMAPNMDAAAFDALAVKAGKTPPTDPSEPDMEGLSLSEEIAKAYNIRRLSMSDTIEDYMASSDLKVGEQVPDNYLDGTGAITQVLGDTIGFGFDMMGAAIESGVEAGMRMLPESFRGALSDSAKEAMASLANTPIGQEIVRAMDEGGKALEDVKAKYPQEYKTLSSSLNLAAGANRFWRPKVGPDPIRPLESGPLGQRDITEKLKGRDKDVFNLVMDESQEATLKATRNTTSGGILGTNERLMTASEEGMVDSVSKIKGVNPALPIQDNINLVQAQERKLNTAIEVRLGKSGQEVPSGAINAAMREKLNEAVNANPGIYRTGTKLDKAARRQGEKFMAQASAFLDEHGTTPLGIHKARKEFDKFYADQAQKSWGKGERTPVSTTESYRAIRDAMNEIVDLVEPDTKTLRTEQSNLIGATQNMMPKAAQQADTAFGRLYQDFGLSDASTPSGVKANLLPKVGVFALSPIYFAGKKFQSIWKSAPIQTEAGRAAYVMRDLHKKAIEQMKKEKDPETRKQIAADLKVLMSSISALESEDGDQYLR